MLIHEVESKIGLTKKSIRYYEEEGLINPKRNKVNDYREYSNDDIKILRLIKFLRGLNVSIIEIKRLKNNELSLADCMKDRIKKIEDEEKKYITIKNMCNEIMNSKANFLDIEILEYQKTINIFNKEGFIMKDKTKSHNKKIMGAIISSIIFSAFFIFFIVLFTWIQTIEEESMPQLLYWFLMIIFGFPVIGIIVNLIKRIKEIKGGEEDEALKY